MKRLYSLEKGTVQMNQLLQRKSYFFEQVSTHNANAMLNTVYYYNCKVLGLCSYDEHRNMQCA